MTIFLRLLAENDKAAALADVCRRQRAEGSDPRVFELPPEAFDAVPGKPFSYWVSDAVRQAFADFTPFELGGRVARQGGVNGDDFRWLRFWVEGKESAVQGFRAVPICKGGVFSQFIATCLYWLAGIISAILSSHFQDCRIGHRYNQHPLTTTSAPDSLGPAEPTG